MIVLGMLQRNGELRTVHVRSLQASEILSTVSRNVASGSIVMTDEHSSFTGLNNRTFTLP